MNIGQEACRGPRCLEIGSVINLASYQMTIKLKRTHMIIGIAHALNVTCCRLGQREKSSCGKKFSSLQKIAAHQMHIPSPKCASTSIWSNTTIYTSAFDACRFSVRCVTNPTLPLLAAMPGKAKITSARRRNQQIHLHWPPRMIPTQKETRALLYVL